MFNFFYLSRVTFVTDPLTACALPLQPSEQLFILYINIMENQMFCFQCQETAKGTGCTIKGVCGKQPSTSKYQDLLLSVVRGVATIENRLRKAGVESLSEVDDFIMDALFSTITNANFDDPSILKRVDAGIELKKKLILIAETAQVELPAYREVSWGGEKAEYETEGEAE